MVPAIHAIILTLNEEVHIARCIKSLGNQCSSITVVDSGSTDRTVDIARALGAEVLVNSWTNYSSQLNFAIDALARRGGWLLRIDADEIIDKDSQQSLMEAIWEVSDDVDGILLQRRIYFLGKRMRYGGIEPSWQLRAWRNGKGRCEHRWMDEHIKVVGKASKSDLILSDINLNSLTWWTSKHNWYANREAIDYLNHKYNFLAPDSLQGAGASLQAKRRRFFKEQFYNRLPSGMRALLYFVYRYIIRLGFLDGGSGWYFHLLQGFWYRTLVDAKIKEIEDYASSRGAAIMEAIRDRVGIDLHRVDHSDADVSPASDASGSPS